MHAADKRSYADDSFKFQVAAQFEYEIIAVRMHSQLYSDNDCFGRSTYV